MTSWNISLPNAGYLSSASSVDELQNFANELDAVKIASLDTETTGLCIWKDIPLYWSTAWRGENDPGKRFTLHAELLPRFSHLFTDPTKNWLFANAKYDAHILANVGIHIAGNLIDTQVMHALLYEDMRHNLKFMAQHLLGWTYADFEDTFGKIGKRQSAEDMIRKAETQNMDLLVQYAANDAWVTLLVFEELLRQLNDAPTYSLYQNRYPFIRTLWDLFYKTEMPYTKVLWKMERRGVLLDKNRLDAAAVQAEKDITAIKKKFFKKVGRDINMNSPAQLKELFFNVLGLHPVKITKSGSASTDESFLQHYKHECEEAGLVLQHREYSKLLNTYLLGLSNVVDGNNRVHTRYSQDVARTGRLSSSEPNLQNVPRPENDKWGIRTAFIAPEGCTMCTFDYEQLEMRLLAAASMEPRMIKVFTDRWDIHMGNASLMYDIPYEDLVKAKKIDKKVKEGTADPSELTDYVKYCLQARTVAKTLGFGLNYGMGANKMARQLGIPKKEAEEKIEKYKTMYPAVGNFFKAAVQEASDTGYAFTLLGRRRNLPEMRSESHRERAEGERKAVNSPIQGTAADVCRMAQIHIENMNFEKQYGCRMLMQVHDELVFECPTESVAEVMPQIIELMTHPFPEDLAVPLEVSAGKGPNWGTSK
jgi:DNA polymerase-1